MKIRSTKQQCHFCQEGLLVDSKDDDLYEEEVGEFWSEVLNHSVLAHPDCLPMGIDATLNGADPEWKLA